MKWLRRLYDWVLQFETSPHAGLAQFLLAFAEASFFPVPPDFLLTALCLSAPARAFRHALVCAIGSVLGGVAGYTIGWFLWIEVKEFFFAYMFTEEAFERVAVMYQENAFLAVFTAGFTPIPYKVFTIAAGVFRISLPVFMAASLMSRSARFFLVAGLLRFLGPPVKVFIDKHFNWVSLVAMALLIGGFVVVKYLL